MSSERRTKIDEKELQVLWNCGMSDGEIAKELSKKQGISISQTGVTRARQRLGLSPHFSHKANPPTDKTPQELYDESREKANQWKKDHPEEAAAQFSKWQTEHREERNAYMRARRNPDAPLINTTATVDAETLEKLKPEETEPRQTLFKKLKTWFINVWRKIWNKEE